VKFGVGNNFGDKEPDDDDNAKQPVAARGR
jgi:hypothetical protein